MNVDRKVIIELRKRTAADSEGSLFIRVSVGGKKPYERESLGYIVPEKQWNAEEMRLLRSYPKADSINKDITKRLDEVKAAVRHLIETGKPLTNEAAVRILTGAQVDIIKYWDDHIKYLEQPRQTKDGETMKFSINYIRKLRSEFNRLTEYTGGKCSFRSIDRKWMEDYEILCAKTLDAQTSLPVTFSKLHTVLVRAEDDGLFSFDQVKGFSWPVYVNPERPYLTLEQTDEIADKIYSGEWNSDPPLVACAAYFLVECYSGIRFSDWSKFKVEKLTDKLALKVRAKKNGQPVYLPLDKSPRLSRILEYIRVNNLKPPETEQHANRLLKAISSLCETFDIELTTHVGRHTAATLFLEMGYSEAFVAEILGISLRTVAIYAKITRRKLTNEYERLGGL